MSPDQEKHLYLEGIRLFNAHQYFEAHEAWEEVWHAAAGLKHTFYQGMIQAAVSLEHYRRANPRGVISLHRSYLARLEKLPSPFMGLNLARFMREMETALRPVLSANPLPPKGQIALDLSTAPKINLEYDPFESGEAERYNQMR